MPGRQRRRVCCVPGCPVMHANATGRCDEHRRELERSRGTADERGYGWQHRREGGKAIAGATHCALCGEPFTDDSRPTRGHIIPVRDGGQSVRENYQPECRTCNLGKAR